MADKGVERPCPCTEPKLPQFNWVSTTESVRQVLKTLHIDKGILTAEECSKCASKGWAWYKVTAIVIATKPLYVVQQAQDVVRQEHHLTELARLLQVLSTLYQEKMVTEQDVEELKPLVNLWDRLFQIQCTKPPDVVKRTAELLSEVGRKEEGIKLKVLSTLYQEKMVTEQDVEELKPLVSLWDRLFQIQCTKPPDVVKRTAELLSEVGREEEGIQLKVLSTLYQEKMIAEQEVEELKQAIIPWDCIAQILSTKPPDIVKRRVGLLAGVGHHAKRNRITVLSTLCLLKREKMVTEQEVEELKPLVRPWDRLVEIQYLKPPDVAKRTAELLANEGRIEEGKRLKVLSTLYQEKMVTEQQMEELKPLARPWDRLFHIQQTKPPHVMKRTAELLAEMGCEEEGKCLNVLAALYQKKVIAQHDLQKWKGSAWNMLSNLIFDLCTRPTEDVATTADVLDMVGWKKEAEMLRVLAALYQKKVIAQHNLQKWKGNAWSMLLDLICDLCTMPSEDVATTADVLDMVGWKKEAEMLRVLSVLYQKKVLAHHEVMEMHELSRHFHNTVEAFWQRLIDVKFWEPPEVVTTTAEVLDKLGLKERATQLRVMSELYQKGLISEDDLHHFSGYRDMMVDSSGHWLDSLVGIQSSKSDDVHARTFDTLRRYSMTEVGKETHTKHTGLETQSKKWPSSHTQTILEEWGRLPKHLLSKESQLVSSLEELSVSPSKTKVSNLQAEGGSDPSEREDTSNLLTDEAALKRLCWIPFGIKTVSIEAKGGTLFLEPVSDDLQEMKEHTIFVKVPPDAVSTSADVKMRYAIIPSGSFTLPEGYQFGSPMVYIYYDGQRVTKPLALHLPHCFGGEDRARDGLSFAVAPHSLKRGTTAYQFQLIGGGSFSKHQQYGTFLIDGHSTLFAGVFKKEATSMYLATQWEQRLACETHTRIVITYNITVWLEILKTYWKDWKRNKAATVCFQFKRYWFTKSHVCGTLSNAKGQEWKATLIDPEVHENVVCYHLQYTESQLEGLVEEGVYPPSIKCTVLYNSPRDIERPSLDTFDMKIEGTNKHHVSFQIKVYNAIATHPAHPEGAAQTGTDCAAGETGSERSVEAVGVSNSAPVVSRGAVAAERSPPVCEAGQPLAKRVLMECQTHFLEVVAVKDIYRELCQKHVIHQTVADKITHSHSVEEARGHLFDHMRDYGTLATLKVFCDVISSDKYNGFRAMQDFGAELRRRLVQEGEHSQRKRSPEGAQQDQPPAETVVRCNLTESEGSVEVVDVSGSGPAVSRGADAAESGPPICEATPPTQPEGAAQTETNPAAGSSTVFAVITANPTEENAVRHFLQLGESRGDVWKGAHECIWENDPYLKSKNITVTDTGANKDCGYEFFTLTRESMSEKVFGVHIKLQQQAAYTKGGSLETTTTLMQHASGWIVKLTDIFSVGCCSYSHDGKSKENLMGYVLLTHEYEAYLNRGKMVEGAMQLHPEVYEADRKWISDLQDLRITKPARQSGTDAQALVKFKDIPVKEVPRTESGPLVVKSDEFSKKVRGVSYRSGIEMEAVGFIKALSLCANLGNTPQFTLVKGISDFGSGKAKKAKTTFFGEKTPALSDDERQLVATLHSIALVIRGVVERYLVPHKVANLEQLP